MISRDFQKVCLAWVEDTVDKLWRLACGAAFIVVTINPLALQLQFL